MRMFNLALMAGILALSGCAAEEPAGPLQVRKTVEIPMGLSEVWAQVGDFCAIGDWHPVVAECALVEENGVTHRMLTLGDGGLIKEAHTGAEANSYSYVIIQGPLPVRNYQATFMAAGDDSNTTLTWTANFLADGVSDDEALELIGNVVFDAGLMAIRDKLEQ